MTTSTPISSMRNRIRKLEKKKGTQDTGVLIIKLKEGEEPTPEQIKNNNTIYLKFV